MTPPDAHRDVGCAHHHVGAHPVIQRCTPGSGSEQLLTGTVLFYPCSHMNPNSVFVGTGPEPLPGIPPFILMDSS